MVLQQGKRQNEGKRSPFSAACVVKSQFKPTVDWKKYMKKSEKSWFFYKSAQCGLKKFELLDCFRSLGNLLTLEDFHHSELFVRYA